MSEPRMYVIVNLSRTALGPLGKRGWHYVIPAEDGWDTYEDIEGVAEAFGTLVVEYGHDLETAGIFKLVPVPGEEIIGAIKEALVAEAFEVYLWDSVAGDDQADFVRAACSQFLQKGRLEEADLYKDPFTAFGLDAFDRLFTEEERVDFLAFLEELAGQVAHLETQAG